MRLKIFRIVMPVIIFSQLLLCVGCISAARVKRYKELKNLTAQKKVFAVILPEVDVYEISAGGVREKRDLWSGKAKQNLQIVLANNFKKRGIKLKFIQDSEVKSKEFEQIIALYKVASYSRYLHTNLWEHGFPDKCDNYEYTIGSVEKILKKYNAEGLLILYAEDEVATKGRKARRVLNALNPFSDRMVTYKTETFLGVIDHSGMILWTIAAYYESTYDLRDQESAQKCIDDFLMDFPESKK